MTFHGEVNGDLCFHFDHASVEHIRAVLPLLHCLYRRADEHGMSALHLHAVDVPAAAYDRHQHHVTLHAGPLGDLGIDGLHAVHQSACVEMRRADAGRTFDMWNYSVHSDIATGCRTDTGAKTATGETHRTGINVCLGNCAGNAGRRMELAVDLDGVRDCRSRTTSAGVPGDGHDFSRGKYRNSEGRA